jgi:hydrogenase expression/formation protein HypD
MMKQRIEALRREVDALCERIGRRVQIMEVCGTHTVSVFRSGIRSMLPANLRLVSGPGCPVCVTAQRHIDAAIRIGTRDDVIVATYGDMMRVPHSSWHARTPIGRLSCWRLALRPPLRRPAPPCSKPIATESRTSAY